MQSQREGELSGAVCRLRAAVVRLEVDPSRVGALRAPQRPTRAAADATAHLAALYEDAIADTCARVAWVVVLSGLRMCSVCVCVEWTQDV